tara:strand:+ start:31 stop:705 length:675 start_codon:yes stop_codon:yes gene_type:complete
MNQFIAAWEFALKNFQYLFLLALPVMVSEMLVAYLIMPLEGMDPVDVSEYMSGNVTSIMIASLIAIVLSVSFTGGLMIAYQSIMMQKNSNPINALFAGFQKFFPLFGATILSSLLIGLGLILLILPAFYFMGRLYLFPAYIMFKNKGVMDSLRSSWEATDEHGATLFFLTLIFFILTIVPGTLISGVIFQDNSFAGIIGAGLIEYIIILPWMYIYFSLYKSINS